MKMLPREFDKAAGEPFRVESYRDAKLEMFYLDDRADYSKFASRGRFAIWTSNGVDYRLFVDKGYYAAVGDLYRNEVNEIWLDYTNIIYGEQKKLSNRYLVYSFILLGVILGLSLLAQNFFPELSDTLFIGSMVVLFIGLFASSSFQQKKLKGLVEAENKKATEMIKKAIGEDTFQKIITNQEQYYQTYFNPQLDEADETEALDTTQDDEVKDDATNDD